MAVRLPAVGLKVVRRQEWRRFKVALPFVGPGLIFLLLLVAYPLAYNFWLSGHEVNLLTGEYEPRGFANYHELLTDPLVWQAARNTLLWVGGSLAGQFTLGLTAALLLNQKLKGRLVLRALLLIPWITPGVVAATTWKWMLDGSLGILNHLLQGLDLTGVPVNWLSDPARVLWSVILVNVWRMFPFVMLMMLAGLQAIPGQLYEAAKIDGATGPSLLRYVTLPMLRPISLAAGLLLSIWSLNSFDSVFVMTQGGPAHASELMAIYVYNQAFNFFQFGRASTAAAMLFLFTAVFAISYIRIGSAEETL